MQASDSTGLLSQPARLGGILGLAFIVLFIVALVIQGETPLSADSADEIRTYFVDNRDSYLITDYLIGVALIFLFLPFAVCLRSILAWAEGSPALLSTLFFAASILILAIGAAGGLGWGTLALGAEDEALDDSSIKMLMYLGDYAFSALAFGFALAALSGSAVMVMTGVIAKWTGYLGILAAILNVISAAWIIDGDPEGVLSILGFVGAILFALWILSTSIMMLRMKEPVAGSIEPAAL